jgi:hypothetical protein
MAGSKKNKDHLKDHAGLALVTTILPPSDDEGLLHFWTQHATDAVEIDLKPFAEGQTKNPLSRSGFSHRWLGPFTGRPELIRELAPHLKTQIELLGAKTAEDYLIALRTWWRLFDAVEAMPLASGNQLARVESVADLTSLHEAAAHQGSMRPHTFGRFRDLANKALIAAHLPQLHWISPEKTDPDRQLISDEMASVLRVALKLNWRTTRKDWLLRDQVRAEADRRAAVAMRLISIRSWQRSQSTWSPIPYRDDTVVYLGPQGDRLMLNWLEYQKISKLTGKIIPSGEELRSGRQHDETWAMTKAGISQTDMLAMQFPTLWEVDTAFHMALFDCGWNPSTMRNLDATDPYCVAPSLKDARSYLTLRTTETDDDGAAMELSMSAPKPRARGKLQTCYGLAKNTCSAPVIVQTLIHRTELLRAALKAQLDEAIAEHARLLTTASADGKALGKAFKRIQQLRIGVRSVWLYVNRTGEIGWLSKGDNAYRYLSTDGPKRVGVSYITKVIEQLAATGKTIGKVTPSDFRDLFARKLLRKTDGSIVALMLALGHSGLDTTMRYVENNVNRHENDEVARSFLNDFFGQLSEGRVDLTILAQTSRNGPLTIEMETRLLEYRSMMRSRLGIGCSDPRSPPAHLEPNHVRGRLCGVQRCALCQNARFLPESLDGFAMRAEELRTISDLIPREAWLREQFDVELEGIESLLNGVYPAAEVASARANWRAMIDSGSYRIPGLPSTPDQAKEPE